MVEDEGDALAAAGLAEFESDLHDVIMVDSTPIPTSIAVAAPLPTWMLRDEKMFFTVKSHLSSRYLPRTECTGTADVSADQSKS
jgi:hypothetical protein